jgi:predicted phosphodiesterase/cell division protein FtsN
MKNKQTAWKLKRIFSKKLSFKLLVSIAILLTVLVGSTFALIRYRQIELSNTQDNTLTLTEQKETDNDQQGQEKEDSQQESSSNNEKDSSDESTPEEQDQEEEENYDNNSSSSDTTDYENSQDNQQDSNDDTQDDQEETQEEDNSDDTESEPEPEPEPPESPSAYVAFYADNQSDSDADDANHQRVVNYILNTGANPIFHAGDLMEDGTQDSLDRFNTVTSTLRSTRTFYAALGNNDRKVGDSSTPSQLFLDNFVFPNNERWYSVNYGNLHMIILDSAFAAGSSTQLAWLSSDLQSSNSQNRITGVIFHHPSFSSTVASYLVNYGADFIISGHLHSYNHYLTSGIDQFVLSGQPNIGYMTALVYSDKVKLTAYNSGNSVIQTVTINER